MCILTFKNNIQQQIITILDIENMFNFHNKMLQCVYIYIINIISTPVYIYVHFTAENTLYGARSH